MSNDMSDIFGQLRNIEERLMKIEHYFHNRQSFLNSIRNYLWIAISLMGIVAIIIEIWVQTKN